MPARLFLSVLLLAIAALPACGGINLATLEPDELQAYALEQYAEGQYRDAQVALQRLITTYPAYAADPTTRLFLANAHYALAEFVLSAAEYKRVTTSFPRSNEAAFASLGVCKAHLQLAPHPQRDQKYTDEAITSCLQTRQGYAGTAIGAEADSLYVQARNLRAEKEFQLGEYYRKEYPAASEVYYLNVVDRYPETVWAPEALLALYRVYTELGDSWADEAEAVLNRLMVAYPDSRAARAAENGG